MRHKRLRSKCTLVFGEASLTDVVLVVDDGVERDVLILQVSLDRLHVKHPSMGLNEALELPVHDRAVSQSAVLT